MGSQVSMDAGAVHVVIVGGGFGGIAAASQLQALNIPFDQLPEAGGWGEVKMDC